MRDYSITAHALLPVSANLLLRIPSIDCLCSTRTRRVFTYTLRLKYIHMPSVKSLHYKDEYTTDTQLKKKTQNHRDHRGHSSTFILSDIGVTPGEIQVNSRVGSGGIQGGCPGSSAWQQRMRQSSWTSPCTQCCSLIISYSINVTCTTIMYKMCTQKKCKVALFTGVLVFVFVVFSLCIFRSWVQPNAVSLLSPVIFPTEERDTVTDQKWHFWLQNLTWLTCGWFESLSFQLLLICYLSLFEETKQVETSQRWMSSDRGGTWVFYVTSQLFKRRKISSNIDEFS